MNIGLDYDDTYTRDPELWDWFIGVCKRKGHDVYITTWRFDSESDEVRSDLNGKVTGIYCTGRKAKEKYMFLQGINIHVWIDDNPWCVTNSMEGF